MGLIGDSFIVFSVLFNLLELSLAAFHRWVSVTPNSGVNRPRPPLCGE